MRPTTLALAIGLLLQQAQAEPELAKWKETHVAKCGADAAWSGDGKFIFGASERSTSGKKHGLVIAWDVSAKSSWRQWEGKLVTQSAGYVACDAAGGKVVGLVIDALNVPQVEVIEDKKGELHCTVVFKEKLSSPTEMRLSPDGVWIAVTDAAKTIGLADADMGNVRYFLDETVLGEGSYDCMAFDGKSTLLAVGWGAFKVQVWHLSEKRVERTIGLNAKPTALAFSSDGKVLAAANAKKEIEIWNAETGQRTATLTGHGATPTALAFSPGGKWLVSGDSAGELQFWDIAKSASIRKESVSGESFKQIRFAPDAKHFVAFGRDVHVWGTR